MSYFNNVKYFESQRLKEEARSEKRQNDAERKRSMSVEKKEEIKEYRKAKKSAAKKAMTSPGDPPPGDNEHDDKNMEPTIIRSGSATTAVNFADEHEDMVHVSNTPTASSTITTIIAAAEEEVAVTSYAGTLCVVLFIMFVSRRPAEYILRQTFI